MDIYLQNFWSLTLDFIQHFKKVAYKKIPIALIVNFVEVLNNDMFKKLNDPSLQLYCENKIIHPHQIQPGFDRILSTFRTPLKISKGKILVYDHGGLRFPEETHMEYFDADQTIILTRETIRKSLHRIQSNIALPEKLIQDATAIHDTLSQHPIFSEEFFKTNFLLYIKECFTLFTKIDQLIDQERLSCILVATTQDRISRIITTLGAIKGIPSICMQHGVIIGEESYMPVLTTKQAVYGFYEKDWYVDRGVRENQIEITGHPQFDPIFTKTFMGKDEFDKILRLNTNDKRILIACHDGFQISDLKILIQNLAQDQTIKILIKPHPMEKNQQRYRQFLFNRSVRIVPNDLAIYNILPNIDVVIVELSTVGLQAILMGIPVFPVKLAYRKNTETYINNCGYAKRDYFDKLGSFVNLDMLEAASLVKRYIKGDLFLQKEYQKRQEAFLSKNYPKNLAGKNINQLINKLTTKKSYLPRKFYPDGTIIASSIGNVYLLQDGMKRHILSPTVFTDLGFNWQQITKVNDNILLKIPHGFVIKSKEDL